MKMNSDVFLAAYFRNRSLFSLSNVTFYLCTNGLQTEWRAGQTDIIKKSSHRNPPTSLRNWYMVYSFFSSQMFLKPKLVSFQEVFCTQLFAIQISGTCLSFLGFVSAINGKRCTFCILSLICCCTSLLCCGRPFVGIFLSNFSLFSHSLIKSFLPFLPPSLPAPLLLYPPSVKDGNKIYYGLERVFFLSFLSRTRCCMSYCFPLTGCWRSRLICFYKDGFRCVVLSYLYIVILLPNGDCATIG